MARWLRERAFDSQASGASNTFVVCEGDTVVGYYSLAAGSIRHAQSANAKMRRNMPDPIPVALLGRLAVHEDHERRGIGSGLLKDASRRCLRAAQEGPGIAAILCHAIDETARSFYLDRGFVPSPIEPLTVVLPLRDLAKRLADNMRR
nr:GNAT family N-acetyltransferase [Lysobacter lactosilyticus]